MVLAIHGDVYWFSLFLLVCLVFIGFAIALLVFAIVFACVSIVLAMGLAPFFIVLSRFCHSFVY